MKAIKEKLYYYFSEKNWGVRREYRPYVDAHQDEHVKTPWKHWWLLIKLNWHYRILRSNELLIKKESSNLKTSQKLPFLNGSESKLITRVDPIHLAKSLMKYDILSFDVFDTLILRPFVKPTDLFMILGEKQDFFDFVIIRQEAERKAREIAQLNRGNREITIFEIYEQVNRQTGIPIDIGVKEEFATELNLCYANPYMKRVYDLLKSQGKKIIITSDMYYPKDMIRQLLENCGYTGMDEIFVSCDYGVNKANTRLFDIVKQVCGENKNICHIGDNINSDVKSAEKMGLSAVYYQNVNDAGNKYRATFDGMSELIGSSYGGIINAHLYNGIKTYSPYYEYGFIYGGLYVMGYCNWIHEYAKINNIDKILFLARDGDIYKRVFNTMFDDVDNEYVYWSRMTNLRLEAERNRHEFLRRYIYHRLSDIVPMSIESILNMFSLQFLKQYLSEYQLSPEIYLYKENVMCFENLFVDHWDEVLDAFNSESLAAHKYMQKIIGNSKKIAVIDIGWAGSAPKTIKWLVEKKWEMDCKVSCLVACAYSFHPTSTLPQTTNKTIESYIFNQSLNRNLKDYHVNTNSSTNNILFELFTQSTSPTFDGFKSHKEGRVSLNFGFAETENYQVMKEVHRGIVEFVKEYNKRFSKYPYMYNISGYDAYIPFRFITRDLKFYKNYFGDFAITRNLGFDIKRQRLETLSDLLESRGLI